MPKRKQMRGLGDVNVDPSTGAIIGYDDSDIPFDPGDIGTDETPDPGIIQRFKNEFADAVQKLDNAVFAIGPREAQLMQYQTIAAQNPDDYAAWQSEMNKVQTANGVITTAQTAVQQVSSWWASIKDTFGLSGLRAVGVLPLLAVPWGLIATITAATAAVVAIVYSSGALVDSLALKAWNAENISRSQQGLPPLPKPELVGTGGFFSGLGDLAKFAVVGMIVYFVGKRFT